MNTFDRIVTSEEYVEAVVEADVELDAQTVAIGLRTGSVTTWYPAGWVGDAGMTRTARTDDPVTDLVAGKQYEVRVRFTDTPEVPEMPAYNLSVKA